MSLCDFARLISLDHLARHKRDVCHDFIAFPVFTSDPDDLEALAAHAAGVLIEKPAPLDCPGPGHTSRLDLGWLASCSLEGLRAIRKSMVGE